LSYSRSHTRTLAVTLVPATRRQCGIRRARRCGASAPQAPAAETERQYVYFCTSKASKLSASASLLGSVETERQYVYFCTSKASKASKASTSASLLGSVAMLEAPLVCASIITKSARSADRPATWRHSVYSLYWYKSTHTDALFLPQALVERMLQGGALCRRVCVCVCVLCRQARYLEHDRHAQWYTYVLV
jgi:hypothetical protein